MITDALLDAIQAVMVWVGGLLPDHDSSGWLSGWDSVLANLGALNYYLPISETFAVVLAVLALFPFLVTASLTVWLVALIRGGSARG